MTAIKQTKVEIVYEGSQTGRFQIVVNEVDPDSGAETTVGYTLPATAMLHATDGGQYTADQVDYVLRRAG